jgi:hypothetical protein
VTAAGVGVAAVTGAGTTTIGTPEGPKNGVVPDGPAAIRRVAVPALIAASVGSDVNATSKATVTAQRLRTRFSSYKPSNTGANSTIVT